MDAIEPILEEVKRWKGTAALALFEVEKLKEEVERLRKRDEFISILDRQIAEKDAEIERLRQVVENWRELVGAKVLEEEFHRLLREDNERLRHALHLIATHPEIHLGAAEEMAAIAEHALQQKGTE